MCTKGRDTHSCAGEQEVGSIHDFTRLPSHLVGRKKGEREDWRVGLKERQVTLWEEKRVSGKV